MFRGFSDETIDFMWGIRFNNERSWFNAHKEEYLQYFYTPMKELSAQLYEKMCEEYPEQCFVSKVTRIYRDARRLHGRGPYKDHLWLALQPPTEGWTDTPNLFFELGPDGWNYGMGLWCGQTVTAAKLRRRMDNHPEVMADLTRRLKGQDEFLLEGPEYAKRKVPSCDVLELWYQKKHYSLVHHGENGVELYNESLVDRIFEGWKFLMPFYEYFATLSSDPDPRDN